MRWIDYFRVLFPSWRFFERPSSIIQLEIKSHDQKWHKVSYIELASFLMQSKAPAVLRSKNLLHNPLQNLALYLEGYFHELSVQIFEHSVENQQRLRLCQNFPFTHNLIGDYIADQKNILTQEYRLSSFNLDGSSACFLHYRNGDL